LLAGRLGHLYAAFDVFAQFGAQFLMMFAGFAVATLVPRYKALVGMVLTLSMLLGFGVWPHLVSRGSPQPVEALLAGEKLLRVAHFNTFANNLDNDAVAREVLRLDADLVSLVEFERQRRPVVSQLSARYPYHYVCHEVDWCNIAVFSRFPIAETWARAEWVGPPVVRVRLGGEMQGLTLFAVHTTRFPYSRAQLRQVEALVHEAETQDGILLFMGDFNATPFSRVTKAMAEGANVRRLTNLPTWPSHIGLPQLAIDHIFAGEGLRPVSRQVIGEASGSDHFPISMTLAFKPR
jgi:endonuclease/exonuclease/phosphatase (EEP) superfamily protein YafD